MTIVLLILLGFVISRSEGWDCERGWLWLRSAAEEPQIRVDLSQKCGRIEAISVCGLVRQPVRIWRAKNREEESLLLEEGNRVLTPAVALTALPVPSFYLSVQHPGSLDHSSPAPLHFSWTSASSSPSGVQAAQLAAT